MIDAHYAVKTHTLSANGSPITPVPHSFIPSYRAITHTGLLRWIGASKQFPP
jgi:hypothetical protein